MNMSRPLLSLSLFHTLPYTHVPVPVLEIYYILTASRPGSGTEIIPGKHSDTRIKPLPLTNGHGRYITVTTERTLVSVGEWPLHITVINL